MALFDTRGTVILLPGTGSDARFVEDAFAAAVTDVGSSLTAVRPDPSALVSGYRRVLDRAAAESSEPVVVGGVSIGAAVALEWAVHHPDSVAAVLVCLPAWTGDGTDAPAAASAIATASLLRSVGLEEATAAMRASSPPWLADMLARSWREQWPHLPAALDEAARYASPTTAVLRTVPVPVGIVGAVDDPIHPVAVAQHWSETIPRAAMATVTLDRIGRDPSILGRLCVDAVRRADGRSAQLLHR